MANGGFWRRLADMAVDPDYLPTTVEEVQHRLIMDDPHRWIRIIVPEYFDPTMQPPARGRHRQ